MPYDDTLAEKVRAMLPRLTLGAGEELAERKMFGGLCFTVNGKMLVGVVRTHVVVRLGSAQRDAALNANRVLPMDFTGKPLANFAYLAPGECETTEALLFWANESLQFVRENMLARNR